MDGPGERGIESGVTWLEGAATLDVRAPPAPTDIRDAISIKEGDLFLLTDLEGNVPPGNTNGFGLYLGDTRFLSGYELAIEGLRPTILLSAGRSSFLASQVLTNPNLTTPDGRRIHEQTVEIRRYRILRGGKAGESIALENFNVFPLRLSLAIRFDADFADMFEVRGMVSRENRPAAEPPSYFRGTLRFLYRGDDRVERETRVRLEPPPARVQGTTVLYDLVLPARGSGRIGVTVEVEERRPPAVGESIPGARAALRPRKPAARPGVRIATSNGLFDTVLAQAREDLIALEGGDGDLRYTAAGIPWYATLFGRDAILTALLDLWISPGGARETLRLLARFQGTRDDPWRDEEPGKILHELRRGEVANLNLVPFAPYYGSIDATPLWVWLLGLYYRATGDLDLVRELEPNLEAALAWIDGPGDQDGDGFVEYRRRSSSGLVNQGWKDSWDSIVHADGSLAEGPIALCEVQAYVYAARRAAADLYRALGRGARAQGLDYQAMMLRRAFDERFWMDDEGTYCLALDGEKRQLGVIASNAGHALACGIVPEDKASRLVHRLMAEDLFSGWGLRTLSSREVRYNPSGYHVGTVWPHDTALVALGMKRYGEEDSALELCRSLFEAARHFPQFRLPELFCGFARSAFGVPVRYPVACSPQAWAAATPGACVQAMLGFHADALAGELRIARPRLPPAIDRVHVTGIPVGKGSVDLRYERVGDHTAVDVARIEGDVRVAYADRWWEA
jgi:glycogen debranching enzyme